MQKDTFAQRNSFAQRNFCTNSQFWTNDSFPENRKKYFVNKINKEKITDQG